LSALHQDVIALLLVGAAATSETVAGVFAKCEISAYLGQPEKLDRFIRQRYIWVSRITGGAQSNSLGQMAQQFVRAYLQENLGISGVEYGSNAHIPGIRHTEDDDRRETTFDLVVTKDGKYVAVEISFQVTTNSVIERKSGQARARYQQIHDAGHKIAYVLDGAGNFQRESALRTICTFSDCTVAFSQAELAVLCRFIQDSFDNG
ncbi:MAG: restriction endonuclease, partial [Anaerolineae bacterium]|nr:restriction endonuclease [Anaerolineae bacterium]